MSTVIESLNVSSTSPNLGLPLLALASFSLWGSHFKLEDLFGFHPQQSGQLAAMSSAAVASGVSSEKMVCDMVSN